MRALVYGFVCLHMYGACLCVWVGEKESECV